jgi:hypothetical protein
MMCIVNNSILAGPLGEREGDRQEERRGKERGGERRGR